MSERLDFRGWSRRVVLVSACALAACGGGPQSADAPVGEAAPTPGAESPAGGSTPEASVRTTAGGTPLMSGAELVARIDAAGAPVILDVRTPEEFAEGHVPGAINISHDELAARLAEIESARDAEVVVYCRSGRRAGIAEELLRAEGFGNLKHLEGDMLAWLEAGRPTATPRR
jgi:rhodanese-related sulfurtransferase